MERLMLARKTLVACVAAVTASGAYAASECGELGNAYGPFDYRTSRDKLVIVERHHFTPDVQALRAGATGKIGADIDYTLRASPNHHRALIAMADLGRKLKTDQPGGANYTVECYFDRAIRFAADDPTVRLIYGTNLLRAGERQEAAKQLEMALSMDPNNANVHYNRGLLYFDLKDCPKSRENAHRAYALGFSLPGLKKKLQDSGHWEPTSASNASTGAAK
jgi:tetratricopeptide (TPR) repeat protein